MNKRNCIVGQSGGPTVAINATLAGVIEQAYKNHYGHVYGMINGISGLLDEEIIELDRFKDKEELNKLMNTPAMYLGSCRFKIPQEDDNLKQRIIDILNKYDITDFFYIGGNDSMDTIKKLNEYAKTIHSSIHFIGIPKTIDNDLVHTLYTPGYPSACNYVITSLLEIVYDSVIYPLKSVTLVEIMGRDAGWLTAASALVNEVYPNAIDIICMPEIQFDQKHFLNRVHQKLETKDSVIIAVSEGVKDKHGVCLSLDSGITIDAFGHMSNNGCTNYLKKLIGDKFGVKVRAIQLSTLQRCSAHLSSKKDIENAVKFGNEAIKCAIENHSGIMVTINSINNNFKFGYHNINDIANKVKEFPKEWIDVENMEIKQEFINYVTPLIYVNNKIELPNYVNRYNSN